ncbi:MAG: hypothetical protein ACAH21_08255 [Ramlibacter sp.]
MKLVLSALATLTLLAACASGPEAPQAADRSNCYVGDAPTGSNLRKRECATAPAPAAATAPAPKS